MLYYIILCHIILGYRDAWLSTVYIIMSYHLFGGCSRGSASPAPGTSK